MGMTSQHAKTASGVAKHKRLSKVILAEAIPRGPSGNILIAIRVQRRAFGTARTCACAQETGRHTGLSLQTTDAGILQLGIEFVSSVRKRISIGRMLKEKHIADGVWQTKVLDWQE